ncbi:DUF305 domain-containing protein [Phycicoccus flavus]|uniref:DUF305 domain-containing protein n=1 Tax=Phycicoccus flavus TaxID=2502783 RepID=UPI000FEB9EFC|nr:DUF305 domain-containing protein [Phycicoccus flavus]NHA67143.1 DUF305 domain-containing protein [Phycicoccus flavus]
MRSDRHPARGRHAAPARRGERARVQEEQRAARSRAGGRRRRAPSLRFTAPTASSAARDSAPATGRRARRAAARPPGPAWLTALRRGLLRHRAAPAGIAVALVLGSAVWGWSSREAPPTPSVASAPVTSGSTPPDPGGVAAAPSPLPSASGAEPETDPRLVQDLVVLDAQNVVLADTLEGSDPEVAALARRVRDERDPDLERMVSWLQEHGAPVPPEATAPRDTRIRERSRVPGGLSQVQLGHLRTANGTDADRLFLALLMRQDEGTLDLVADHLGPDTGDDGLRALAGSVTATRTERIAEITAMLERLT